MSTSRVLSLTVTVGVALSNTVFAASSAPTHYWQGTKWARLANLQSKRSFESMDLWSPDFAPRCVNGHGLLGVRGAGDAEGLKFESVTVMRLPSGAYKLMTSTSAMRATLETAAADVTCTTSTTQTTSGTGPSAEKKSLETKTCTEKLPPFGERLLSATACTGFLCQIYAPKLSNDEILSTLNLASDLQARKDALINKIHSVFPKAQVFAHRFAFGLDWELVRTPGWQKDFLKSAMAEESAIIAEENAPISRVQDAMLKATTLDACCKDSACSAKYSN